MHIFFPPNERTEKLPIYPRTLGLMHPQGPISRPDGTYLHHVFYICEGEGFFDFNGNKKILGAGNAIFMKKTLPVAYRPASEDFKTAWLTFDGNGVEGIFDYFGAEDYSILAHSAVVSKIAELFSLCEKSTPAEILSAKTYALVIEFFDLLKSRDENGVLEQAKEFIRQNYQRDLSVENIASSIGISQSLLFKLFRIKDSSTPMEYLRTVRLEAACRALADSALKISDVGRMCGFSDTSYFCKVFKENIGKSPAVYRKDLIHW